MKHTVSILSLLIIGGANAASVPWWQQPTICRLNPTNCYPSMGAGYDAGMWDATSNCRGMKYICGDAITPASRDAELIGRAEIAAGTKIKSDFDTNILNGDCFGVRKTTSNGTMASVNGTYVNVWCPNVLSSYDESLPNGEIKYGTQPTCSELARDGIVAVLNNKCFGKVYNTDNYYIECGSGMLPNRIIVLNGATDYSATASSSYPVDQSAANRIFDTMYTAAQANHKEHFKSDK